VINPRTMRTASKRLSGRLQLSGRTLPSGRTLAAVTALALAGALLAAGPATAAPAQGRPAGVGPASVSNPGFEAGTAGWSVSGPAGAATVESGGADSAHRLTHYLASDNTVTTSQTVTGLKRGGGPSAPRSSPVAR